MGIRGGMIANSDVKEATISAVVTRADGSIENLGVIAYHHKNPLRRFAWELNKWFKERFKRP